MKRIKLSAIDSTNSFLKEMVSNSVVENFTIVVTDNQVKGRGQQRSVWLSEPHKNLMFSVFVHLEKLPVLEKKHLNFAVSLAIFDALHALKIPNIFIKWPNDIVSGNKKICGVLIENSLKGSEISSAVIGIGLNVNQTQFPDTLKKASSLQLLTGKSFDLEALLKIIITALQAKIAMLNAKDFKSLEAQYLNVLYKKNIPSMFSDREGALFMGIICGTAADGKLQVKLEDETIREFGIKEISFL